MGRQASSGERTRARARRAQHFLQFPSNCIAKSKHSVEARIAQTFTRTRLLHGGHSQFCFSLTFHLPGFLALPSSLPYPAFRARIPRETDGKRCLYVLSRASAGGDSCDGPISCRGRYATVRENLMKNESGQIVHGAGSWTGPFAQKAEEWYVILD